MEASSESLQSELLVGKQLVIRMQYDDFIVVSRCHLDNALASIGQSLQKLSMSDYDVTLGARVHTNSVPTAAQAVQSNEVNASSKCEGGCGLKALISSPTENYSYYAQTALRPQYNEASLSSTILVEIFVNEKIESWDKKTQGNIITSVTQAIDTCIVKQQATNKAVRGFESVIEDYVPEILKKVSHGLLYCVSIATFAGLVYLNYADVGICNAVKMIWSL